MAVVFRVTAESSTATEAVNVFHFKSADVNRVTEAQGAIDALEDFYDAIKADVVMGTVTIGRRVVTVDKSPNSVIAATSKSVTTTGTGPAPLACAAVLSFSTANIGPRYRGRAYIGPLDDDDIQADGRSINTGIVSLFASSAFTHLMTNLSTAELVVWSRKFNTSEVVTGIGVNPIVGIQRRRLT